MTALRDHPRIPYGEANFQRIRLNRWLYVDKTRFLRRLEDERYAFLIRPRRFGKTLWVSLLENYYGRHLEGAFDAVFADTDIGRNPTEERSRYVVLRFNFSLVNDKVETLEREFEYYCGMETAGKRCERHPDLFPAEAVVKRHPLARPSVANETQRVVSVTPATGKAFRLYLLSRRVRQFRQHHPRPPRCRAAVPRANPRQRFLPQLLRRAERRRRAQPAVGWSACSSPASRRVTLDDVTSGFNIGKNISLRTEFNAVVGFTEDEVRRLAGHLPPTHGAVGPVNVGHRPRRDARVVRRLPLRQERQGPTVYNTDMVLYFLDSRRAQQAHARRTSST